MAFDDWMGQLLCDMTPFLEDSGFAYVRAAAEANRPSPETKVVDFAEALSRRRGGACPSGVPVIEPAAPRLA
jgi:hypothetical protein